MISDVYLLKISDSMIGENNFSLIGTKIRDARLSKKMTQAELADGIVTRNMISRIENGLVLPSVPSLCDIAKRLDLPVGYFLDDDNDGSEIRRERLFELIKHDYMSGQYESCIEFCRSYGDDNDEISLILADCSYRLGMQKLISCDAKNARTLFGIPIMISEKSVYKIPYVNDCRMMIVLCDAIIGDMSYESLYNICEKVLQEKSDHPFSRFCRFFMLCRDNIETACEVVNDYPFGDDKYYKVAVGMTQLQKGNVRSAKKAFVESLTDNTLPPVRVLILSELERLSAEGGDFEKAYAYAGERERLQHSIK